MQNQHKKNPHQMGPIEFYPFVLMDQVGNAREDLRYPKPKNDGDEDGDVFESADHVIAEFIDIKIREKKPCLGAGVLLKRSGDGFSMFSLNSTCLKFLFYSQEILTKRPPSPQYHLPHDAA
jgi:hypothetical protein